MRPSRGCPSSLSRCATLRENRGVYTILTVPADSFAGESGQGQAIAGRTPACGRVGRRVAVSGLRRGAAAAREVPRLAHANGAGVAATAVRAVRLRRAGLPARRGRGLRAVRPRGPRGSPRLPRQQARDARRPGARQPACTGEPDRGQGRLRRPLRRLRAAVPADAGHPPRHERVAGGRPADRRPGRGRRLAHGAVHAGRVRRQAGGRLLGDRRPDRPPEGGRPGGARRAGAGAPVAGGVPRAGRGGSAGRRPRRPEFGGEPARRGGGPRTGRRPHVPA